MTDLRKAAKEALWALAGYRRHIGDTQPCDAEIALLDALAQQEEPVQLRELLIQAASMAVAAERAGKYGGASWVADAVLEDCPKKQAEPVQEPVAWLQPKTVDGYSRPDLGYETCSRDDYGAFPVHTSPPQRKPLTEEEIDGLVIQHAGYGRDNFYAVARAVERAHGIKE